MKLGFNVGSTTHADLPALDAWVSEAEARGYDSMWLGETYGPDCYSFLAYYAAKTTTLRLGTSIAQIYARPPASTAAATMTLDHVSGGRFILGLGVSGPQVVEGWYGQEFDHPLGHTREYIEIVRKMIAREEPVAYDGQYYQLPVKGGSGLGKPIKSILHPFRRRVPIFLGAEGPKNISLSAEIADGWIPTYFSPKMDSHYRTLLAEGFAKRQEPRPDTFETIVLVNTAVADTVEEAADRVRPGIALYIGGMGARDINFHYNAVARLGYEAECQQIQDLWMSGNRKAAIAAVPTRMIEDIGFVGPKDKIKEDLAAWRDTVATTLLIRGDFHAMRTMAEIVNG